MRSWIAKNGPDLHRAGLTPDQGRTLYDIVSRLAPATGLNQLAYLVTAARMANLDPALLSLWARANLLPLTPPPRVPGKPRTPRPAAGQAGKWITLLRAYVRAACGDETLAAHAALAGLSPQETSDLHASGQLDLPTLTTMCGLRETDELRIVTHSTPP
ncbi:hypothetical protein [Tessaracoccus sp.]